MPANLAWREHSHSLLTPNLSSSWTLSIAASHINQLFSIPHGILLSNLPSITWKMWGCASSSHSSIFLLCCKDAENAGSVHIFFYSIPTQNREDEWTLLSIQPANPLTWKIILRVRVSYRITCFGCCLPKKEEIPSGTFLTADLWQAVRCKLCGVLPRHARGP